MLQLNRLLSLAVASTLGAAAALASAAEVPKGRDAAEVTSLSALPAAIREHLATQFGDVSDRSGPFNPGCVVLKDVPRHRFVRGSLANDHAVVAVEHDPGRAPGRGCLAGNVSIFCETDIALPLLP